jgi:hypothetical protein
MRIIYTGFLVVCCILALAIQGNAAKVQPIYVPCTTTPTDMDLVEVGKVKTVLKSNQIQLENGQVFILDNMRVPVPYEHSARDFIENLMKDKTVGLYANKTIPLEGQADEHGNEVVHAVLEDGTWVEQAIVGAGLAWVDSGPNNRDCVYTLYKTEIIARAKKLGFWAAPEYKIHTPDHTKGTIGTFILFEGVPKVFRYYGDYDFFGFGTGPDQNQRTFTIALKHEDEYRFISVMGDPVRKTFVAFDFAHSRMRVRGWVEPMQGSIVSGTPMMRITNPEQMELPDGLPYTSTPIK